MKGYKVYRNKYHTSAAWNLLKEQSYDQVTISIFRSETALRQWIVTRTGSEGDVTVTYHDNDIEAWREYHSYCISAAENDSEFWFNVRHDEKVSV